MIHPKWPLCWIICAELLCTQLVAWAGDPAAGVDDLVGALLAEGGVPGLALVVVKDDKVVVARGYGARTEGKRDPVDADTLFGIASLTKAFTATGIAMLVDRRKLGFDDTLATALPGFRVADPYVSAHLTLRDALAHRTGTSSSDLLWYAHKDASVSSLIGRLGALPQASSLREQFGYSNLMYMVAGELLARRSGIDWDRFVATEMFAPLGMTRSSTDPLTLAATANVATPHIRSGAHVAQVPHHGYKNIAASGSIYSSANDMARWMRFLLNDGQVDGRRLVGHDALAQTMTPQMLIGPTGPADDLLFPRANFIGYAMGWFVSDYRGRKTLSHTGSIDGMAAFIALLPEERLGVAVLTNLEGDMARAVIRNWLFDRYLGANDTDWQPQYSRWNELIQTRHEKAAADQRNSRVTGTRPTLPLPVYVGWFENALLGDVEVRVDATKKLEWRFESLPFAPLRHWQYDSFQIQWPTVEMNEPPVSLLSFQLGADGAPARIVISSRALPEDAVFNAAQR
jgi:CubicO group peptidase (beta-lactamase class C family)